MAAPKSFLFKSFVFTPAGQAAITFSEGVQEGSWVVNGQRITWSGDGVVTVQAQAMEDIDGEITINTIDVNQAHNTYLDEGTTGSAVLTYIQRASGKGSVTGEELTVTASDCMVTNRSVGLPHRGNSSFDISFSAVSADGSSPLTLSSALT